ncbi:MAG: TSUP family transporter [Acidimicrobiales bacterium]
MVLASVTDRSLGLTVGFSILVAVVLSVGVLRVRDAPPAHLGAGAVSGFGATAAGIGGPPMALVLQHRPGAEFRATMSAFFAIGTLINVPAIAGAGRLGRAELLAALVMTPGVVAGFVASGPLRRHVDAGRVRPLVLLLSSASAVALILKSW